MYSIDPTNGDILIGGFDKGIGESPYSGLTDVKSVNILSVPGEAAVNFSTQSVTLAPVLSAQSGTVVTATNLFQAPTSLKLEQNQFITFDSITSGGTGLLTATPYKLFFDHETLPNSFFSLFTTGGTSVTITADSAVTFSTVVPATPKYMESMSGGTVSTNFMLDSSGRLWTDATLTIGGGTVPSTSSWTWTGNTPGVGGNGNGLVYWRTSNATSVGDWDGWLFIFRNGFIDYINANGVNNGSAYNNISSVNAGSFTYGWNPVTGTTGITNAYLSGANVSGCPHTAIVGPDGNVYFCDYFTMWKIQQFDLVTPITFSPTNTASYIVTHAHNLPIQEVATWIAPLGNDFIIGGTHNQAYIWNGVDQLTYTNTILLAESYVSRIVTVNTNAYIFCGNRGNIYITNGSQANPWVKVPDHISGTIEPYFSWGGAVFQKDRIYFGVSVAKNDGSLVSGYGGVWCVDVNTKVLSLSNQLSYGTYAGYASAFYAVPPGFSGGGLPTLPTGVGLFIGWYSGTVYGIDKTISTPYLMGQSYIISDMIPIGTALQATTPAQFEYKLATPLVAGEKMELLVASSINATFTSLGSTTTLTLSDIYPNKTQLFQWLLVKAVMYGTSATPTYNRLTQIRVKGATVRDNVATAPFGTL